MIDLVELEKWASEYAEKACTCESCGHAREVPALISALRDAVVALEKCSAWLRSAEDTTELRSHDETLDRIRKAVKL